MLIREAVLDDVPALVILARREHHQLVDKPGHPFGTFDENCTADSFRHYIMHTAVGAFVAIHETESGNELAGYIVCIQSVAPFNHKFKFGMDAGFYSVRTGAGRALIHVAEEWSRSRGLEAFVLKRYHSDNETNQLTDIFYRRAGYHPMEIWHIRNLKDA